MPQFFKCYLPHLNRCLPKVDYNAIVDKRGDIHLLDNLDTKPLDLCTTIQHFGSILTVLGFEFFRLPELRIDEKIVFRRGVIFDRKNNAALVLFAPLNLEMPIKNYLR